MPVVRTSSFDEARMEIKMGKRVFFIAIILFHYENENAKIVLKIVNSERK